MPCDCIAKVRLVGWGAGLMFEGFSRKSSALPVIFIWFIYIYIYIIIYNYIYIYGFSFWMSEFCLNSSDAKRSTTEQSPKKTRLGRRSVAGSSVFADPQLWWRGICAAWSFKIRSMERLDHLMMMMMMMIMMNNRSKR